MRAHFKGQRIPDLTVYFSLLYSLDKYMFLYRFLLLHLSCPTHHRVLINNWLLFLLWCYGFSNFNKKIIFSKKFKKLPEIWKEGSETKFIKLKTSNLDWVASKDP